MNGQRQRSRGGRRRRRKAKAKNQAAAPAEPVLIAARRPNSPVIQAGTQRPKVAASAKPKATRPDEQGSQAGEKRAQPGSAPARRAARIVRLDGKPLDDNEIERRRLLQRLLGSEGRSAISRAADDYKNAGFDFPDEQDVHLQLLAHFNETLAGQAIEALTQIVSHEAVRKRPVLDQRLRRLEEYADEGSIREAAANLRRQIRS